MRAQIAPAALRRLGSSPVRIDWYGNIARVDRLGDEFAHVALGCSRLDAQPPNSQFSVHVPAALLRIVRMGDIWQSGTRIDKGGLARVTFRGLVIQDDPAQIVPCGSSEVGADGADHHELPFEVFGAHKCFTKAYVARVDAGPSQVLIVPSMELIRFYFGSSGLLLSNAFSGAFAEQRLFQRATLDPSTGVANITLADNLPGVAAATVARIAFDKTARKQFRRIVNSGIAAAVKRDGWFPRVGFPFEGTTDLTVEGVWIERSTDRAFVAHRLVSCTHPFPFQKLYYRSTTLVSGLGTAKADKQHAGPGGSTDQVHVSEDSVDKALAPAAVQDTLADDDEVAFPDLASKVVRRVKSSMEDALRRRSAAHSADDAPIELGLDGRRAGEKRAVDVSGEGQPEDFPLTAPRALQQVVAAAKKMIRIAEVRAPWGKGAADRGECRDAKGQEYAFWAARLDFRGIDGDVVESLLCIAAEQPAAVELLVFAADSEKVVSEERCQSMSRMFWVDPPELHVIAERHSLMSSWTRSAIEERGGETLLQALRDHYFFGLPYPDCEEQMT